MYTRFPSIPKRIPPVLVFLVMKIRKQHPIYVSKKLHEEKHVDLKLNGEEWKRHYVFFKYFNTFMYDNTLQCRKSCYFL